MSDIMDSTIPPTVGVGEGAVSVGDASSGLDSGFDPVESNQPAEVATLDGVPSEEPAAPEANDQGEYLFEIDGQKVTLEEARNSFLRQSDYTRKTQELAEQRKALQRAEAIASALERDPQATVQAIAQAYGIPLGNQAPQTAAATDDPWGGEAEEFDPVAAEIAELKAWRAQQEQERVAAQIDREVQQLRATYGEFDEVELYAFAVQGGYRSMTDAYKALNFDRVMDVQAKAREEEQRIAAKREQAGVVHAGSGVKPPAGATSTPKPTNFREAAMLAFKQHGLAV